MYVGSLATLSLDLGPRSMTAPPSHHLDLDSSIVTYWGRHEDDALVVTGRRPSRRRRRRRRAKVDPSGTPFSRALAADGHVVLGEPPDLLVGAVDADRRQRVALTRHSAQDLDGVATSRALVQAEHARRLRAAARLHVRRKHAARHALPEPLQVALVRRRRTGARLSTQASPQPTESSA